VNEPKKYIKKPVGIEAYEVHHYYVWASFLDLLKWGAPCHFVPKGNSHPLRREAELEYVDSDNPTAAPAFIAIKIGSEWYRLDPLDWVIKPSDGGWAIESGENFKDLYVEGTVL